MNDLLKKLERKAGVAHVKGRAFHAFRRAVATLLVEQLGTAQASMWIGDKPEVIMRTYVKPSQAAQADAARFMSGILDLSTAGKPLSTEKGPKSDPPTAPFSTTSVTGPAGLEPATPGFGEHNWRYYSVTTEYWVT